MPSVLNNDVVIRNNNNNIVWTKTTWMDSNNKARIKWIRIAESDVPSTVSDIKGERYVKKEAEG